MEAQAPIKRIRPRVKRAGSFHHGDLREALIAAGLAAVERHGHGELSLRPLARRLGVTQPAVYRHFADKQALLAAVAERGWLGLDAAIQGAIAGARDPYDVVRRTGRAYIDWAYAHPNLFRLFSSRVSADVRGKHPPLPRAYFHRGLGGAVPIDDPLLFDAFRATWAVAHGLSTFVVERVFQLVDTDAERLAAAYAAIDCHVEMLRARWPGAAPTA